MIKDVTDSIKMVADAIKNVKEIHDAIKDGKGYFNKTHPEIKKDVAAMCAELQKTCNAIATASRVITNFRFNSSAGVIDNEPTRFNDYFIEYKTTQNQAEELIRGLKGHCYIIKRHAENVSNAGNKPFWSFFGLASQEREAKLGLLLQQIYDDERDFHSLVYRMAHSMNATIEDVTNELCENGMMTSARVPQAALLLESYSRKFKELEIIASLTRDELNITIMELQ